MTRPVVFSTHKLHPRAEAIITEAAELRVASALDDATLIDEGRDASVVIVRAPIPAALFDAASKLKIAIRHGAGIDMIPMEAATKAGVMVANVPGVNAPTVAEHVFMVSLALLRQFRQVDRDLRAKGWNQGRDHAYSNSDLGGRTLGIIGFGNVGSEIARIGRHGFKMTVLAHSRTPKQIDGVHFVDLDALVTEADIIVLCCPLTPETKGLMNAERIGRMKPMSLLINVSRGPVVVDDALVPALREGRIAGAALDVFVEQPLPTNHPYYEFSNVIITPHMAGITEESMMRMGVGAAEQALQVLRGGLPANLRNAEVLAAFNRRFHLS
ncbi:MAG: hydroxyacid dehydrogenase [Rhizobiaceae bacterium]